MADNFFDQLIASVMSQSDAAPAQDALSADEIRRRLLAANMAGVPTPLRQAPQMGVVDPAESGFSPQEPEPPAVARQPVVAPQMGVVDPAESGFDSQKQAMEAQPTGTTAPQSARPPNPQRTPWTGERVMTFGRALQGADVAHPDRAAENENMTVSALTQRGLDPGIAAAVVRNPQLLQVVAPAIFGRTRTQVINNRIVDSETGRVIADLSDSDKLITVPEGGTLVHPRTGDVVSQGRPRAPQGFEWVDPNDRSKGLRAIPGGPGTHVSSEVAGRLALMRQAHEGVSRIRDVYERAWNGMERSQHLTANIPYVRDVPALSGAIGQAQREVRTAIEAALRTMTGAAAPETEVQRYLDLFQPGLMDTPQSAKQKLDNLLGFMAEAERIATQGRTADPAGQRSPGPSAGVRTYNPATGRLE